MKKNDIGENIIKILKKHPEGLTIIEISKEIEASRHSVANHISNLLRKNLIYKREVGTAKLCYLGKKYDRKSL